MIHRLFRRRWLSKSLSCFLRAALFLKSAFSISYDFTNHKDDHRSNPSCVLSLEEKDSGSSATSSSSTASSFAKVADIPNKISNLFKNGSLKLSEKELNSFSMENFKGPDCRFVGLKVLARPSFFSFAPFLRPLTLF